MKWTREQVEALHAEWRDAEQVFENAYHADPNRRGMRGGDFRYRDSLHSPETKAAGEAFVEAGNRAKTAFREYLAQ